MVATYTKRGGTPYMDDLFVTTLDKVRKEMIDLVFRKYPALAVLLEVKDDNFMASGGEQFQVNVEYAPNPNGGWMHEDESISMEDYELLTSGFYDIKHLGYGIRWPKSVKRINRGSQAAYNLVDKKISNTTRTIQQLLNSGLWTGDGTNDKILQGLPYMIPATLPASQTTSVGGISPVTYPLWRTQASDMDGISSTGALEDYMLNMCNTIQAQGGKPSWIFCDQATHETYEKNARDFLVEKPTKIADVNFMLCEYKGIPVIFDLSAPAGEMRFVDGADMKFCVDPMFWMEWTDWKEIPNVAFTKVKQVICDCNMARTAGRTHGCIFNISE